MKAGDKITVLLKNGKICVGKVHTLNMSESIGAATRHHFAQVRDETGATYNAYLALADENKTWIGGHDKEKLAAALAAEAMAAEVRK